MTCIIGIEHEQGSFLLADSASANGWNTMPRRDGKLIKLHMGMALGFTSSYRMGQLLGTGLLEWVNQLRTRVPAKTWEGRHRWMVRTFVPEVRRLLEDGGYLKSDNGRLEGGTFMVALGKYIFVVEDDLQVSSPEDGYWAVGAGAHYALGAMHYGAEQLADGRESHEGVAHAGMRAAMRYCNGVDGRTEALRVDEVIR